MRLLGDGRGTASVEIVVMLPVFILLWFGVLHVHRVGSAALLTAERARGCALQFAVQGCVEAESLELCQDVRASKTKKLDHDAARGNGSEARPALDPGIADKIEKIPVVGALWASIFGEGSLVSASVAVARFRAEGTDAMERQHYMVCNTISKTWADLRKEQLCGLGKQLGISGKLLGCD